MSGPNRTERARIAAETVAITQAGRYTASSGREVDIGESVRRAVEQSRLFTPDELPAVRSRAQDDASRRSFTTAIEVMNEGTFTAGRRLVEKYGPDRVAALNFASAKNPGGGFLGGSQAQEESLARASALVPCLERNRAYYDANRREWSLLYTDHMIVSPRVPVFRDERDALLETPWAVTIITAPAPNAGAIAKNEPQVISEIEPTFRRRIENVLAAAVTFEQTAIVLGAWGCGVFANDPGTVARLFAEQLQRDGRYSRAFEHVAFAVLDRGGETFGAFAKQFS